MSLFDRLKKDNNRILTDDMRDLTLINALGYSYSGKGRYTDINFQITPQGELINTRKNTLAFSITEFESISGTDESYKNWRGSFLNSKGETVIGLFNNIFIDRTLDYVSCHLTEIK